MESRRSPVKEPVEQNTSDASADAGSTAEASRASAAQRRLHRTLYEVLQVSPYVEQPVLQAAYRALARSNHPDLNPSSSAAERMRELNEAYDTLSNPKRRAHYDLSIGQKHPVLEPVDEREVVRRRTECWNCGGHLPGAYARYCGECHWLLCEKCGSCGCKHPTWQPTKIVVGYKKQAILGWGLFIVSSLGWLASAALP